MYPKYTVANVLNLEQAHLEELSNNSWHARALHAIRKCRTRELGGRLDWCKHCNALHLQFNSCRNRHCPTCQGHKQQQWIQARMKEVLPVPYFHVVFTVPHDLNSVAMQNPGKLYKILFDSVWQTITAFGNDAKYLGAKMGMIAVLHTWGQNLSMHPHVHCIIPKGGVSKAGYWKQGKKKGDFLFPVKAVSKKFRGLFVAKLRKQLPGIPQSLYDALFKKDWVVYTKPVFGNPEHIIKYLARYTYKTAIGNHRILDIDRQNSKVTFSVKQYQRNGEKARMTLSTREFVRRFQQHILPKGFRRIRHYGILSSSWKKEKLPHLQEILADKEQEFISLYVAEKPLLNTCPVCKKTALITLLTFDNKGPPENYKEIAKRKIKRITKF